MVDKPFASIQPTRETALPGSLEMLVSWGVCLEEFPASAKVASATSKLRESLWKPTEEKILQNQLARKDMSSTSELI